MPVIKARKASMPPLIFGHVLTIVQSLRIECAVLKMSASVLQIMQGLIASCKNVLITAEQGTAITRLIYANVPKVSQVLELNRAVQ